jgi:hypothetical protein
MQLLVFASMVTHKTIINVITKWVDLDTSCKNKVGLDKISFNECSIQSEFKTLCDAKAIAPTWIGLWSQDNF